MMVPSIPTCFRASLALYKLTGEVDYQWDSFNRGRNVETITWEKFEEMFQERFFNETAKTNKVVEFMNTKQDDITIA